MFTDRQKREVFHFLFLERLLKLTDARLYIVKGGVNLRFFFQSPRYSEDMDIDVLAGAVHTLKKNGFKILEDESFQRGLRAFGIDQLILNDPVKAKQTETVQRFRVRLMTSSGEALPTKIEFSRRKRGPLSHSTDKVNPEIAHFYQRLAFPCPHYTGEAAVLQKVFALANRERTQARDLFDLQILADAGYLTRAEPKKHLAKPVIVATLQNIHTLSYDDFSGHVLEYLDESARDRYSGKIVWEKMKETITEALNDGP